MADVGQFTIRTRRDTETNWATVNPVLAEGEEGLEMDTLRYKVGDGITEWNLLPYWTELTRVKTVVDSAYTLQLSDNNTIILFTNPLGCTVTLPTFAASSIPIGFITHLHQDAVGRVGVVAASGVTTKTAISLYTRTQNSSLSVINQALNVYKIIGDAFYE